MDWQNNSINIERNYGIDFLRILSMWMILQLHMINAGGILSAFEEYSSGWWVAYSLLIFSMCGVNCFGLISGYVGINSKKTHYSRTLDLWMIVVFYGVIITSIFAISMPEKVGKIEIVKSFMPLTFNHEGYWYFTSYVALSFIMPLINKGILNLEERRLRLIIVLLFICFSCFEIFGAFNSVNRFHLSGGHSLMWLIFLYIAGAYMRLYIRKGMGRRKWGVVIFLCGWSGTILLRAALHFVGCRFGWSVSGSVFGGDNSPTIFAEALGMVLMLSHVRLSPKCISIVKVFSPSAFSTYILHMHWCIFLYFLQSRFCFLADFPILLFPAVLLFCSSFVYVLCAGIDVLRRKLFFRIHIDKLYLRVDKRIEYFLNQGYE